jgi:S1-C subfamily serine protease
MPILDLKVRIRLSARLIVFATVLIACGFSSGKILAQDGGGGAAGGPTFKVLRSMAGSSGTESKGRLVIDDPRTVFYLGQDHKIIVYFEWEGPPGQHKFEGVWKNADSKVTLISDFQYVAPGKQFSGYWTMLLSGSEAPGLWTLEAHIDGESAGDLSFQLIAGPDTRPPAAPNPSPRQPLATPDLYKRLAAASIYIDKMDSRGKAVTRGSDFYLDDGQLVTAFQNVDGATKLRVISPDGSAQEINTVLSWNRWQDWAILPVNGTKVTGVPRAALKSWAVGSVCYFLQTASGSGRIMADGTIVGQNTFPRAGERLNLAESPNRPAIGSPLVNEFGEVVGMVGGSLAPGTDLLGSYLLAAATNNLGPSLVVQDGLAVPINLIPATASQDPPTTLDELTRKGQMVPLLSSEDRVLFAGLALTLEKKQGMPTPNNAGQQFTHKDQRIWVYVNWNENMAFKGTSAMTVYDVDNHEIAKSNPQKVSLHAGSLSLSTWEVPLASLPSGIYRVDVMLGDNIVWRKFFRLTD